MAYRIPPATRRGVGGIPDKVSIRRVLEVDEESVEQTNCDDIFWRHAAYAGCELMLTHSSAPGIRSAPK